jgi:hypothetical protein
VLVGVGVGELVLVGVNVGHGTHLSQILSKISVVLKS